MNTKTWKKATLGLLGAVVLGLFSNGVAAFAADETDTTPPEKVTFTVHKLMYDVDTKVDVAIDGIKNDGYAHDTYPDGVSAYHKADYGTVEFTLANITSMVLPNEDSELTNAKVDEIVADVEKNGTESPYVKNASSKQTLAVDDNGEATFADQPGYVNGKVNAYVLVETKSPAGLVATKAKPMVLTAPMTSNDGKAFLKTIHVYPKNITQKQTLTFTKYGDDGTDKGKRIELKGITFDLYKGEPGKGTKLGSTATDDKGTVTVKDLTVGKFYFVELPSGSVADPTKEPTEDQYLLGADARNDEHNRLTFEITPDGVTSPLKGSYVNYKAPVIDKIVDNGSSFQVGDRVHYVGTLHVPNDVAGGENGIDLAGKKQATSAYSVLQWRDTAGKGLSYIAAKADLKVTNSDGSVILAADKDYKLTNKDTGFVVDFIVNEGKVSDNVAKLHGQEIKLQYNMLINDTAVIADPLTNDVDLAYSNNPFAKEEHHSHTSKDVFTYGAKFLKIDSGFWGFGNKSKPLEGAAFAIKNKDGKFFGGIADTDKDGVKELLWVASLAQAQPLKSDKDGKFELAGLAEGTYALVETKAPTGYQKQLEDISFKVNKESYKEASRITIKNNQKSTIASTGSKRLVVIGILAALLVAVGIVILVLFKGRREKTV